ncbi:MAG: DUF4760 domain-containing protein [Hyphomicrobiaceae bacterium]|nr:DUF4760 domain-containing protein [Hyphomicrobiaceae bacterium]
MSNITLRLSLPLIISLVALVLAYQHYHAGEINEAAQIVIAGAAFATLVFTAVSLFNIERGMTYSRRQFAINMISEWSNPHIGGLVDAAGIIRKEVLEKSADEITIILNKDDEKRKKIINIMNYLENIALSVKHKATEEEVIRDYFEPIFKEYHRAFMPYIEECRRRHNNTQIWSEFQRLAEKWG